MMEIPRSASWTHPLGILTWIGIWTIPGLISASQLILSYQLRGDAPDIAAAFRFALPGWYIWGALAPLVFLVARRFPLEDDAALRRVPLHLAANVAFVGGWVALVIALRTTLGLPGATSAGPVIVSAIGTGLLVYWTLVLIHHALGYRREREARARREAELAGQLSRARLSALKAQLHPHFLFNTLNAISAFVRSDPARAETMLAELGDLLREVLEAPDGQIVPLSRELDFVDRYLSIQETRLGDRLEIRRRVDGDARSCGVPTMLLQPLVENAVEHGIARRRSGGVLQISAEREGDRLRLTVADDGPGASEEALDPSSWRVGLKNTRARLEQLFGDQHEFTLTNGGGGGVTAVVVLPVVCTGDNE